jgi:hypothetical protein
MWRRSELLSRAKRALECGGLTPLCVAGGKQTESKRKVRDREDALASKRDARAPRNFRCNAW